MALDLEYQRAAEAALAADQAAAVAHAALFDFARELGDLVAQLQARNAPLAVRVRFVRRQPPHLDAPAGVHVEDAGSDRPPAFAALFLEARDLFFAIESVPGVAIAAVTNVPQLEGYAGAICGIREDTESRPHLLVRSATGTTLPAVHTAAALLEAYLAALAAAFAARAGFNPLPPLQ